MSPSTTTTRWCPTPEQLMILEELYRRGLRTPNASQIQRITAHLSLYGNIQGKNVFYWFQNHKARDRQKLRKKLANQQTPSLHHFHAPQIYLHHPQVTAGVCEEVPEEVMRRQIWRGDLPKDCSNRSYGHDSIMIMNVGPTFPYCTSKPLQTLELFPLRPPTPTQKPSSSYFDAPAPFSK